jgi:hypothetical protein
VEPILPESFDFELLNLFHSLPSHQPSFSMKHANVGVIQPRYGFCFALEALLWNWAIREMCRQNLDSHRAI